jgi:hypothetical protein
MSDVLAVWQRLKSWFQDYAPELVPHAVFRRKTVQPTSSIEPFGIRTSG